jgi:hypothetical protein
LQNNGCEEIDEDQSDQDDKTKEKEGGDHGLSAAVCNEVVIFVVLVVESEVALVVDIFLLGDLVEKEVPALTCCHSKKSQKRDSDRLEVDNFT